MNVPNFANESSLHLLLNSLPCFHFENVSKVSPFYKPSIAFEYLVNDQAHNCNELEALPRRQYNDYKTVYNDFTIFWMCYQMLWVKTILIIETVMLSHSKSTVITAVVNQNLTIYVWQQRLSHAAISKLKYIPSVAKMNEKLDYYLTCTLVKSTKLP